MHDRLLYSAFYTGKNDVEHCTSYTNSSYLASYPCYWIYGFVTKNMRNTVQPVKLMISDFKTSRNSRFSDSQYEISSELRIPLAAISNINVIFRTKDV